jgi:hypothetical protein
MKRNSPIRLFAGVALALVWAAAPALARGREPGFGPAQPPPRVVRREAQAARQAQNGGVVRPPQNGVNRPEQNVARPPQGNQNRPALELWMERHQSLSPDEQRRQLQNEPGFRELPPQLQQREMNELNRLQTMSPEQRSRRGALLRMTPIERQQFTTSVQQYMALPPERRQMVRRAFGVLRTVPPRDRAAAMNNYPMMRQFSEQERGVLGNLLVWEPYFSDGTPGAGP